MFLWVAKDQAYHWAVRKTPDKLEGSIPCTVIFLVSQSTAAHSPGPRHSRKSLSNIPSTRSLLKTFLNISGHVGVCDSLISNLRMKTEDDKIRSPSVF